MIYIKELKDTDIDKKTLFEKPLHDNIFYVNIGNVKFSAPEDANFETILDERDKNIELFSNDDKEPTSDEETD